MNAIASLLLALLAAFPAPTRTSDHISLSDSDTTVERFLQVLRDDFATTDVTVGLDDNGSCDDQSACVPFEGDHSGQILINPDLQIEHVDRILIAHELAHVHQIRWYLNFETLSNELADFEFDGTPGFEVHADLIASAWTGLDSYDLCSEFCTYTQLPAMTRHEALDRISMSPALPETLRNAR